MIDESVGLVSAQLGGRKDNRMEGHVVLGHKLVVNHLLPILPPAFPFVRVARRDAQVTDGRIKPNVKHLQIIQIVNNHHS